MRRARDFFGGARGNGHDARQRFAGLIHRRRENGEFARHVAFGSTRQIAVAQPTRVPHENVQRLADALDRVHHDDDTEHQRHADQADQPCRATVGFIGESQARGRHLLGFHGAESLDVIEQIVDRPARLIATLRAASIRPRSARRWAMAYDTSMADSLLSIDATIATSVAAWPGRSFISTLDLVCCPAVFPERVLRCGVLRLEIARARFDGLRDVCRERARKLRLRLDLAERLRDRERHAGERATCDDAGDDQQRHEDAKALPQSAADRVEAHAGESLH